MVDVRFTVISKTCNAMQGRRHKGTKATLKISKKEKIKKYRVFSCIKVIKISFSVIFNEEIRALEGFLSRF